MAIVDYLSNYAFKRSQEIPGISQGYANSSICELIEKREARKRDLRTHRRVPRIRQREFCEPDRETYELAREFCKLSDELWVLSDELHELFDELCKLFNELREPFTASSSV